MHISNWYNKPLPTNHNLNLNKTIKLSLRWSNWSQVKWSNWSYNLWSIWSPQSQSKQNYYNRDYKQINLAVYEKEISKVEACTLESWFNTC